MRAVFPVLGHFLGALQQAVTLVDVQRRERGRTGYRVRRVGVAVEQVDGCFRALHEGVVDALLDDDGAHGQRAVRQALGTDDDVRRDAEFLRSERRAGATEAGDDFVENEQDAVAVAGLTQTLQIALGRQHHTGAAGDGLDDDGGNV